MTRLALKNGNIVTKKLTSDECRAIGVVAGLSLLLVTIITFAVSRNWQVTTLVSLLAIPGSLFGGALWIFCDRLPKPKLPSEALKDVSLPKVAFNVVVGSLIYTAICHAVASPFYRLVVAIGILAIPAIIRRVYKRYSGTS